MICFASKPAPQQLAWPWLASGGAASSSGGLRRAFGLRRAPAGARGEMATDSLGNEATLTLTFCTLVCQRLMAYCQRPVVYVLLWCVM